MQHQDWKCATSSALVSWQSPTGATRLKLRECKRQGIKKSRDRECGQGSARPLGLADQHSAHVQLALLRAASDENSA